MKYQIKEDRGDVIIDFYPESDDRCGGGTSKVFWGKDFVKVTVCKIDSNDDLKIRFHASHDIEEKEAVRQVKILLKEVDISKILPKIISLINKRNRKSIRNILDDAKYQLTNN